MDRLTTHSHKTGSAVPSERLGDICLRVIGCDDYDFCEGCPIREMLNKLCAYEDTGLTPEQINQAKEIFIHSPNLSTENERMFLPAYTCSKKMISSVIGKKPSRINNKISSAAEPKLHKIRQKVSRYGLFIRGKKYYLTDLVTNYFCRTVDVVIDIQNNVAMVYDDDVMVEWFNL